MRYCFELCVGVAATVIAASSASSQTNPGLTMQPNSFSTSPFGVDLRTGSYVKPETDLTIGDPAHGGIEHVRSTSVLNDGAAIALNNGYENPAVNYQFFDIPYTKESTNGGTTYIEVKEDGLASTFYTNDSFASINPTALKIGSLQRVVSGSNHYYVFKNWKGETITTVSGTAGSLNATSVTYAGGVTYNFAYGSSGAFEKVSNSGYALIGEANGAKFCVINLTATTLPSNYVCPTGVPTVTYAYSGSSMTSLVNVRGQTELMTNTYTAMGTDFQRAYYFPGASTPYLTNSYGWAASGNGIATVKQQVFADGETINYGYLEVYYQGGDKIPTYVYSNGYTDQDGNHTGLTWDLWIPNTNQKPYLSPAPASVKDPLLRFTYYDFCHTLTMCSHTLPSGIQATFTIDGWGNTTNTSIAPATGSSLSPLVTKASFDCSTPVHCTSPTSTTDANNNETDITYDSASGLPLTKTGPAVNGVRPQTRYIYAQRYAWVTNGSGGYIRMPSPMWLVTQESTCKSGAAAASGTGCALGSSDEVITTYDYGPDSGPNNLRLRGKVEDAGGLALRTCYSYDYSGRKISETSPRAGLTSCP